VALRADDLVEVRADDHSRILRLLAKRHRDLGRSKNRECCRLHSLLLEMVPGGAGFKMSSPTRARALIETFEPADAMGRQRLEIALDLVDEIGRYDEQLKPSQRRIRIAVAASNTSLTSIGGLGPITAAVIIGHTGSIDRVPDPSPLRELQRDSASRGCGCPKLCRGWSGCVSVLVDEAVASGRFDDTWRHLSNGLSGRPGEPASRRSGTRWDARRSRIASHRAWSAPTT
jgi:hypothetical protein